MQVDFDATIKVAGIGVMPWPRLGLERWLPAYKIVTTSGIQTSGLQSMPPIIKIKNSLPKSAKTITIVAEAEFRRLIQTELAGYQFLPYRPLALSDTTLATRFLMNSMAVTATYENKVWLRHTFGSALPFAPYKIIDRAELMTGRTMYAKLIADWPKFVLQHESLGGGQGTYIVHSYKDYVVAVKHLPAKGRIVASAYLGGAVERSLQCCTTKKGVLYGELQRQIIRQPLLCDPHLPAGQSFCGIEVGTTEVTVAQAATVKHCVETVYSHMQATGYKGIWGIDFMVHGDDLYVLEVNARSTAATPLLTQLYRPGDIPFGLLHLLELGEYDYSLRQSEKSSQATGSLLRVYNTAANPIQIGRLASGVYRYTTGSLQWLAADMQLPTNAPDDWWVIQDCRPADAALRPGRLILQMLKRGSVLNGDDSLSPYSQQCILAVRQSLSVQK